VKFTRRRLLYAALIVLNLATFGMAVLGAIEANKHRAAREPFLDTWDHHAEQPASAPAEFKAP
jgi:hypothetical protein